MGPDLVAIQSYAPHHRQQLWPDISRGIAILHRSFVLAAQGLLQGLPQSHAVAQSCELRRKPVRGTLF